VRSQHAAVVHRIDLGPAALPKSLASWQRRNEVRGTRDRNGLLNLRESCTIRAILIFWAIVPFTKSISCPATATSATPVAAGETWGPGRQVNTGGLTKPTGHGDSTEQAIMRLFPTTEPISLLVLQCQSTNGRISKLARPRQLSHAMVFLQRLNYPIRVISEQPVLLFTQGEATWFH
jgi:hypothetical protein